MQIVSRKDLNSAELETVRILWRMLCAGFRHSSGFHTTVILGGAACRLRELGDVHNVLGVLGVGRVVPIVVRVLVSWYKEE